MTLAYIKEYIDKQIKYWDTVEQDYPQATIKPISLLVIGDLNKIYSMLDELEPKAKWTNNMNGTFTCSRCGAKRPNDNYCGNCGAIMNDELKENNK